MRGHKLRHAKAWQLGKECPLCIFGPTKSLVLVVVNANFKFTTKACKPPFIHPQETAGSHYIGGVENHVNSWKWKINDAENQNHNNQ